jgi:hypothetical protein
MTIAAIVGARLDSAVTFGLFALCVAIQLIVVDVARSNVILPGLIDTSEDRSRDAPAPDVARVVNHALAVFVPLAIAGAVVVLASWSQLGKTTAGSLLLVMLATPLAVAAECFRAYLFSSHPFGVAAGDYASIGIAAMLTLALGSDDPVRLVAVWSGGLALGHALMFAASRTTLSRVKHLGRPTFDDQRSSSSLFLSLLGLLALTPWASVALVSGLHDVASFAIAVSGGALLIAGGRAIFSLVGLRVPWHDRTTIRYDVARAVFLSAGMLLIYVIPLGWGSVIFGEGWDAAVPLARATALSLVVSLWVVIEASGLPVERRFKLWALMGISYPAAIVAGVLLDDLDGAALFLLIRGLVLIAIVLVLFLVGQRSYLADFLRGGSSLFRRTYSRPSSSIPDPALAHDVNMLAGDLSRVLGFLITEDPASDGADSDAPPRDGDTETLLELSALLQLHRVGGF